MIVKGSGWIDVKIVVASFAQNIRPAKSTYAVNMPNQQPLELHRLYLN